MQRNTYRNNNQRQSGGNKLSLINQEGNDGFKQVFHYQKVLISRVLWTGKNSILRIVPGNDGHDCFPQVINQDIWTTDGDQLDFLSDTFYMVDTVDHFGNAALEFVSSLEPGSDDAEKYGESPVNYFCNTVHKAVRDVLNNRRSRLKVPDVWKSWTNLGGILPYPRETLFFQAMCTMINGSMCKESFDEDASDAPLYGVIGIKHNGSIKELLKALIYPMDRRKPIGTDNNTFGALAELEGNVLYLNSSVDDKGRKILIPSVQSPDAPSNQWESTPAPIEKEAAMTCWVPWDKVFHYLTVKEQVELLCAEFGTDTVQYVFSQDKRWEDLPITGKPVGQTVKAPARSAMGMSMGIPKKPVAPAPDPEPAELPEDEPTWEPPKMSKPASPGIEAEKAKILNAIKGKSKQADLSKALLEEFDDADFN